MRRGSGVDVAAIKRKLKAELLGRGAAWLDAGTIDDFNQTSLFVSSIENRQGLKISCLEEIALNNKWIGKKNNNPALVEACPCIFVRAVLHIHNSCS